MHAEAKRSDNLLWRQTFADQCKGDLTTEQHPHRRAIVHLRHRQAPDFKTFLVADQQDRQITVSHQLFGEVKVLGGNVVADNGRHQSGDGCVWHCDHNPIKLWAGIRAAVAFACHKFLAHRQDAMGGFYDKLCVVDRNQFARNAG